VESLALSLGSFRELSVQRSSAGLDESLAIARFCAPTLKALKLDGFPLQDLGSGAAPILVRGCCLLVSPSMVQMQRM
jgi:hypothetical protein